MGYHIIYEESAIRKVPSTDMQRKRGTSAAVWWILTACCILAFVLHNSTQQLREYLLPGDPEVTQAAITAFADDLRAGESVKDAFTAFCLEIIENAQMS